MICCAGTEEAIVWLSDFQSKLSKRLKNGCEPSYSERLYHLERRLRFVPVGPVLFTRHV